MNLAITYICTGKYNVFFKDFYESYKDNFCKGNNITFVVITDKPTFYKDYKDCKLYHVQRYYKASNLDYIKFRKWRDILLAEDYLACQDYCFYMNSNLICKKPVTIEELFNGKDQYAVHHSLSTKTSDLHGSLCKNPKSASYFDYTKFPNYVYYQAGNVGATSKKFLKMCAFIESSRQYDEFNGVTSSVPWHDETYYNKYINLLTKKNFDSVNVLDGKMYLCTWLTELKPYASKCKMMLTDKTKVWNTLTN